MIFKPFKFASPENGSGAAFASNSVRKFKAKELGGHIISALDAFQKACARFDYDKQGEKGFRKLAGKMTDLFKMAREQNEMLNLYIKENPVNINQYELSYNPVISEKPDPDIQWDYQLHALLKYSRDSGKITVSAECNAPSLHWTTKINRADEDAFFDGLKLALTEVRNFSGDYATSPLFMKALNA